MPESKKPHQSATADPVSAVKLPAALTASIDAWAGMRGINRAEAIRRLVELGLPSEAAPDAGKSARCNAAEVEELAVRQLEQFIDPETPQQERERRIHRLTDGPPEFVGLRIDLPRRGS